jgi:transcriptional regulator with XRE-family HTH domain
VDAALRTQQTCPKIPLGISIDFLGLIERGNSAPSFETIEQMAKRLRLPVKALFEFGDGRQVRLGK